MASTEMLWPQLSRRRHRSACPMIQKHFKDAFDGLNSPSEIIFEPFMGITVYFLGFGSSLEGRGWQVERGIQRWIVMSAVYTVQNVWAQSGLLQRWIAFSNQALLC